jgi:hypothetical protein
LVPNFQYGIEYPVCKIGGKYIKLGWLVLEKTKGPKPNPKMVMRHFVCGNSKCCNPRHLVWGTEKENMADKKRHGTEPDFSGTKNPNSKLTIEDIRYIREHYKKGRGPYRRGNSAELASRFGVTQATITVVGKGM